MNKEMKSGFKKQLWISFGIIGGAIVAASVAVYFLSGDIDAQATQIITAKTAIAQQAATVGTLASLKSDAVRAASYAAVMGQLLLDRDELIAFPQWVATAGVAHNVQVSVVFQGGNTTTTASLPASDGFSLSATGAAVDLAAFLDDIETQKPGFLIAIDSIDLTNNGASYQLSAQGKVFSQ